MAIIVHSRPTATESSCRRIGRFRQFATGTVFGSSLQHSRKAAKAAPRGAQGWAAESAERGWKSLWGGSHFSSSARGKASASFCCIGIIRKCTTYPLPNHGNSDYDVPMGIFIDTTSVFNRPARRQGGSHRGQPLSRELNRPAKIPSGTCARCGCIGKHATPMECIDALREVLAEFTSEDLLKRRKT